MGQNGWWHRVYHGHVSLAVLLWIILVLYVAGADGRYISSTRISEDKNLTASRDEYNSSSPASLSSSLANHGSTSNGPTDLNSEVILAGSMGASEDASQAISTDSSGYIVASGSMEIETLSMTSQLDNGYVLLSTSATPTPENSVTGALIASKFVVTRGSWFKSPFQYNYHDIAWALFNDEEIPIAHVSFEKDYIQSTSADNASDFDLLVFELEQSPANALPFNLPTSVPPSQVDISTLFLQVWDPVLLTGPTGALTFNYFALEHLSVCGIDAEKLGDEEDSSGVLCLHSTDAINSEYPMIPLKMMFVKHNGYDLIGLDARSSSSADKTNLLFTLGKHIAEPFIHLAADVHRHFLDEVTNQTVNWVDDDQGTMFAQDTTAYFASIASLYRSSSIKSEKEEKLKCGGMVIAPSYILTTASCVLDQPITAATFGLDSAQTASEMQDSSRRAIDPDKTVIHPLYQPAGKSENRYDLALLRLVESTDAPSINLEVVASLEVGARTIRVTNDGSYDQVVVLPSEQCHPNITQGSENTTSWIGMICAGEDHEIKDSQFLFAKESSSQLSVSLKGLALLRQTSRGLFLVGLELPQSEESSTSAREYISVLDAANFVNSYAVGQTWGLVVSSVDSSAFIARPIAPINASASAATAGKLAPSKRFVVGLRITKNGQNFCGGSLIAPSFVITAAHCVTDGLVNWVSVGSEDSAGANTEAIAVLKDKIRIHPQYRKPYLYSYDVALLELAVPAYAPTVVLDNSDEFQDKEQATMYGYGATSSSSDTLSPVVHALALPLWSRATCAKILPNVDDASVLCAGGDKPGNDACTGDSGGPLVRETSDGDYLVGLVSAGYGCGLTGVPGLYARIAAMTDFINAYVVGAMWRYPGKVSGLKSGGIANNQTSSSSKATTGPDSENRNSKPATVSPSEASLPADSYDSPLTATSLADVVKSSILKKKLLAFLLGKYETSISSSGFAQQVGSLENLLTLYSSGDLDDLLAMMAYYDNLPLNQRVDRFETILKSSSDESSLALACQV